MTPSIRLSFFSTRAAHEAHVIPPIMSSASEAFAAGVSAAAVLAMSELLGGAVVRWYAGWSPVAARGS
ncbi:hypothetical protein [Streptomyces sp. HNA39]|uniref:hypothetical protein n=1 Tax=Streptomyces sp. HNA39 TaxID=2850561 RepID=UPI00200DB61D|nr:hypothetical protein [Streptomyces sp. HNA39]